MLRPPSPLQSMMLLGCGGGASFVGPLDAYASGIVEALSIMRRLLASYAGPLILVRRSSDDTTLPIGAVGGLLDVAALLAFCGAGDGFVVTIYGQANGRDVTCSSASAQLRIVNGGVLETVGTQGRASAYSTADGKGPYYSDTFTTNTSATFTAVSTKFIPTTGVAQYFFGVVQNSSYTWGNADSIMLSKRQATNARVSAYYNLAIDLSRDITLDTIVSTITRADGSNLRVNIGGADGTAAFSNTLAYNRLMMAGISTTLGGASGEGDRHMEHVLWDRDLGATDAEAVRAEQAAFYA